MGANRKLKFSIFCRTLNIFCFTILLLVKLIAGNEAEPAAATRSDDGINEILNDIVPHQPSNDRPVARHTSLNFRNAPTSTYPSPLHLIHHSTPMYVAMEKVEGGKEDMVEEVEENMAKEFEEEENHSSGPTTP